MRKSFSKNTALRFAGLGVWLFAWLGGLGLWSCPAWAQSTSGSLAPEHPTPQLEKIVLQLKWRHQFQFAGFYAAIEKGYYRQEGLEVEVRPAYPGLDIIKELVSDNAQYAVYDSTGLVDYVNGQPLVAMAALLQHSALAMLSHKDSGILSPSDLPGHKIISVPHRELEIEAMCLSEGVHLRRNENVVEQWNLDDFIERRVEAISAYVTDETFDLDRRGIAYNVISPRFYGVDFYGDVLYTSMHEFQRHPRRAQAFLRASVRGWYYAMRHPDEIVDIIQRKYDSPLSREHLLSEAKAIHELMIPELVEIGHMNTARWEHIGQTCARLGLIPQEFSLDNFLYPALIDQQKNGADRRLWIALFTLLGLALAALIIIYYFNYRLRRAVKKRTSELYRINHELTRENQERRRIEKALRDSELRYRTLFESAGEGIMLMQGQYFVDCNQTALDIFRCTNAELIGHSPIEFSPPLQPDGRLSRQEGLRRLDAAMQGQKQNFEWQHKRADGTLMDSEVTLNRITLNTGNYLLTIVRDVSQTKRVEKTLQMIFEGTASLTGEGFFRSLVRHLAVALNLRIVMVADLVAMNQARTLAVWCKDGYMENFEYELEGTPCQKVVEEGLCVYPHEVSAKFPYSQMLVDLQIDSYLGTPLTDATGHVLGLLVALDEKPLQNQELIVPLFQTFASRVSAELARVRAEHKQQHLEEQLRQAQKMEAIGQLAGGIAHDFNNLLQAIEGYTELATSEVEEDHPATSLLSEVLRASRRASTLVRQLLAFGRRETLKLERLDLNEVVSNLAGMIQRLIGEDIELLFTPGHQLWAMQADAGQIEQILVNLCVNARDAMPQGGQISIQTHNASLDENFCNTHSWASPGEYILLKVTDTGVGMPEEVKEHIFEPFFTTKDVGKGTGLGLSMVYGIIKQHKGIINLSSQPGRGTTFYIYLPAVQSQQPSDTRSMPGEARIVALQSGCLPQPSETILLAEDDPLVRSLAIHVLTEAGYRLLVANDGEHAMELFLENQSQIDLAFLDVVMPKKSGNVVRDEIHRHNPSLPVLFSSGYSRQHLNRSLSAHDHVDLIMKPYRPAALLSKIRQVLESASTG